MSLYCATEAVGLFVTSNIPLIWSTDDKSYHANLTSSHLNTTIELTCFPGPRGLKPHTRLQWWEEMIPLEGDSRRELVHTQGCGLTLRLHRLSILDYGRYQCKCVNEHHDIEHGIQFDLEKMWKHDEREPVVNLLSPYSKMARLLAATCMFAYGCTRHSH